MCGGDFFEKTELEGICVFYPDVGNHWRGIRADQQKWDPKL